MPGKADKLLEFIHLMHKLLYLHLISVNIFLDPTYRSIVLPYCISVALNALAIHGKFLPSIFLSVSALS